MSESANTAVPSALGRGGLQNLLRHLREIRHRGAGAGRSFDPTTTEKDCSSGWFFKICSVIFNVSREPLKHWYLL